LLISIIALVVALHTSLLPFKRKLKISIFPILINKNHFNLQVIFANSGNKVIGIQGITIYVNGKMQEAKILLNDLDKYALNSGGFKNLKFEFDCNESDFDPNNYEVQVRVIDVERKKYIQKNKFLEEDSHEIKIFDN
jgi:hypothetical protein